MPLIPVSDGPVPTFVAPSAGADTFENDGTPYILIVVPGPGVRTLTVRNPHAGATDFVAVHAPGSSTTARFDPLWWNDPKTGRVEFEFDDPIGIAIAVIRTSVIQADPSAPPAPGLF